MPPETKKRFSFTDAAAKQPERQRFSFTGAAPKQKTTIPQAMDKMFPHRQMLRNIAAETPKKPTVGQMAKEFIIPGRGYTDKQITESGPSTLKDKTIGTAKWAGEVGVGLASLVHMGGNQLARVLPGHDPKRAAESRNKLVEASQKYTNPSSAEQAKVMRGVDVLSFVTPLTVGKLGKLSTFNKVKNAAVASNTPDAARLVLKEAGITDDIIDYGNFDARLAAAKTADDVTPILREVADFDPSKVRVLTPKKGAGQTAANTVPVASTVTPPPKTATTAPVGRTTQAPFSFTETAKQTPTPPVGRTRPAPFSFTDAAKQAPAPAVARTATPDPRNFKTADEFVAAQGDTLFHTTKAENVPLINKNGFSGKTGEMSKASGGSFENGTFLYPEKQSATTFGKNFKSPEVIETAVQGKIYDANSQTKYGWEDDLQTQEIAKNKEIVDQLKKDGFVGVKSTELGTDAVFVFDNAAIKTKSQLTDIWNQAQKSAPATTPKVSKTATEAITQRLDDIETTKQWQDNPVQAQKESTQAVAKKYSNTDAEKGFVTDAVNHMDNVPPIKNVTAKARNFAKNPDTPIDLPPETLRGWLQTRFQDTAYRLALVQKQIIKQGGKISDDANAYMQREAYIGRAAEKIGRFEKKLGMVAGSKNGLLMRAKKDGIGLDQLDEYMRAKAAKARNARVASLTGGKVADGGSGLTNKQADEILARYKDNSKIEEYAKEFRDTAINPKLQVLKEAGILTDEQIKLITKGEPDYVPFKVEEFSRPQGGGKGFSVKSSGVKGLKGSARSDRTNAVMQSHTDYQEAVIRAEKNKSLQSFAKMIRENPDSTLWEIRGVTYTPQYNKYGEMQFLRKNPINEKTSVEFFENGKAFEIRFHDEALARVFTEQGVTKPIPGLIKINNYLRAVNTVINPEFMITNAIRDAQTAMVIAGGEKGAVVAAKMLKDYPSASKGIWQAVRKESNTGWAKVYNEMVENGGRTGWFDLQEVGETTRRTSKLIERYNSTKTSDALMRAIDSTGKLISDANEVFEMSIRTSAYKQLVDGGMSKVAAANYAKNMTVNFNKKGNWGMFLNSAYLFANAGIQGSARLLMAMKYPEVRRITYGIVGSSYALNELNTRINPEGYERLQDFEKERNLIVMLPLDGNKYNIPGISGDPANGYYLKMPLPYGFNVFKVAGDITHDVVNKKKTNAEAMVQMLRAIDASFNPLSSGTASQFISPTVVDPFISHWENKNWFGAPIMPEQPAYAPAVRDSDRYFSGARDLSVETAQFFNRLTGGNEVTSGAVDISPETIDHVIDTLGGGLGNFMAQFVNGTVSSVKGDIPTPDEMPFIRKLIDTPFETGEQSTVFTLLEKSATNRMSAIEIDRFITNATRAIETGQIDDDTAKRVIKDFVANAARQEAGEVLSLVREGKFEEAQQVIAEAPPSISKELEKLIEDDVQREIKRLKKELGQ